MTNPLDVLVFILVADEKDITLFIIQMALTAH